MSPVKFGAHLGQQNLKIEEIRAQRRFDRPGSTGSRSGTLLRGPARRAERSRISGRRAARRARYRDQARPARLSRVLPGYRNPALAKAATTSRPSLGRPLQPGPGRGLAVGGAAYGTSSADRRAHGCWTTLRIARGLLAGAYDVRRSTSGWRRIMSARAAAAAAADLGRRLGVERRCGWRRDTPTAGMRRMSRDTPGLNL
jgi:hypothetical protein